MNEIKAVIFDLDGTLISLEVDFNDLRRRLGIQHGPVWEAILEMEGEDRCQAEWLLLDTELAGAQRCRVMPGARELLAQLDAVDIPCGILTRNCREAVRIVSDRHGFTVEAVLARGDAQMKPKPDGVIELARRLDVPPHNALVVGDYLFDVEAGRRAGSTTALFIEDRPTPDYAHIADYVIRDLLEVVQIIARHNGHGTKDA